MHGVVIPLELSVKRERKRESERERELCKATSLLRLHMTVFFELCTYYRPLEYFLLILMHSVHFKPRSTPFYSISGRTHHKACFEHFNMYDIHCEYVPPRLSNYLQSLRHVRVVLKLTF